MGQICLNLVVLHAEYTTKEFIFYVRQPYVGQVSGFKAQHMYATSQILFVRKVLANKVQYCRQSSLDMQQLTGIVLDLVFAILKQFNQLFAALAAFYNNPGPHQADLSAW